GSPLQTSSATRCLIEGSVSPSGASEVWEKSDRRETLPLLRWRVDKVGSSSSKRYARRHVRQPADSTEPPASLTPPRSSAHGDKDGACCKFRYRKGRSKSSQQVFDVATASAASADIRDANQLVTTYPALASPPG